MKIINGYVKAENSRQHKTRSSLGRKGCFSTGEKINKGGIFDNDYKKEASNGKEVKQAFLVVFLEVVKDKDIKKTGFKKKKRRVKGKKIGGKENFLS